MVWYCCLATGTGGLDEVSLVEAGDWELFLGSIAVLSIQICGGGREFKSAGLVILHQ